MWHKSLGLSAFRVLLLPGIVLPAKPAYGALIAALGPDVEVVAKDLEVYATPEPREDYSLEAGRHRMEPERLANSLKTLWRRAERSQPSKP